MIECIITKLQLKTSPYIIPIPINFNGIPINILGIIIEFDIYGNWNNLFSHLAVRRRWHIQDKIIAEQPIEVFPEKINQFITLSSIPYFIDNASECSLELVKIPIKTRYIEPIYELSIYLVFDY